MARIVGAAILGLVVLLLLFQDRMIYHPRRYEVDPSARVAGPQPIMYRTGQGRQEAYYLGTRDQVPRRLWVVFPGNGTLALDWLNFLEPVPDPADGYLLVDYPGYGNCEGAPSRDGIEESTEAAYAALAAMLHTEPTALDGRVNVLSHSLGCATGLNFAVRHPVQRVILLAPFTSLRDMARRTVGWPLCWLLRFNYDNRARLGELAARASPPKVTIFHGEEDGLIPVSMGRELVGMYPGLIAFHAVPGADHNSVLMDSRAQVLKAMDETEEAGR